MRSSIPEAVLQSRNEATRARQWAQWLTVAGLVGLVALGIATWTLIQDTWKVADDVRHQLIQEGDGEREQTTTISELQKQLQSIDKRVTDQLSVLQEQVDKVQVDVNRVRTKSVSVKEQGGRSTSPK